MLEDLLLIITINLKPGLIPRSFIIVFTGNQIDYDWDLMRLGDSIFEHPGSNPRTKFFWKSLKGIVILHVKNQNYGPNKNRTYQIEIFRQVEPLSVDLVGPDNLKRCNALKLNGWALAQE